jgi:CheY-like chemotaxis protein
VAGVTVGSRNTYYRAARYGLTRAGLSPAGLHQLLWAPSEMDGLSVCDHLQDADQAPANVIVITGSKHPHTLERCERDGTYCARKGPNFWNDLEAALAEIDPRVALLPRVRES